MALPDKRIHKITLPGDISGSKTYEIIPEKLENNNYEASLPSLTEDSTLVITSDLAAVATSGSYTDLENTPRIPDNTNYVDLTTDQVIDGQKDFKIAPRIKVSHTTHNLPAEYQEVEYLASTGTQYINTGFIPSNDNYEFDIVMSTDDLPGTANAYIGYRNVSSATITGNMRYGFIYGDRRLAIRNGVSAENSTDTITLGAKTRLNYKNKILYLNEVQVLQSTQQSSSPTYKAFHLFSVNTDGYYSVDVYKFYGKIYSCKLYDDDTLTNYLIPCYRISDDKPGMYDIVRDEFFVNSGTGEFTTGDPLYPTTYETVLTDANFAPVAYTGDYTSLTNRPTNLNQFMNGPGYITSSYHDSTKANQSSLDAVTEKIPSAATSSNQLADKAFVNSSIETATATFRGTYTTLEALQATTGDLNDYTFYNHTDVAGNTVFDRYKYTTDTPHWVYEYTLNNSSFTAAQWAAINSGVAAGDWVDMSTAQIISGQKDFNTIPRVKVEHTIHNLPDAYQEVEYLESTGTQYIDTGVILTNLHAVEIDYQLTSTQQTNRRGLYGILSTNAASRFGSLFSPTNYYLEHGYGVTNIYWQQGLPDANRHLLKQDKNITYIDGIVIHTFNEATFTTTGNALLGNFNYTNYIPALAKYYESKWWNDGVLIRDFIPCYRKSDDKPGYYDIVNDIFYTNAGTGDFVLGPNVEPITYESLLTDASFATVATSGNFADLVNKPTVATYLTSITGYNATKTQTLKNINGVFTWVNDT